jgi:hypothetical protein
MSEPEPKLTTDEYDRAHGDPSKTPAAPKQSEADAWGTSLNPVRETPLAGKGLKSVGG